MASIYERLSTLGEEVSEDDDVLPSLAAPESDTKAPNIGVSGTSELFQSSLEKHGTHSKVGGGALLSSGLLSDESAGIGGASSSGGGLFDQIDEEEKAAQEEEERKRLEQKEKIRIEKELRKEKRAAEEARILLQKEGKARLEADKAKAIAEEQARKQQQLDLQTQQQELQQQHQMSYMNSGSVMGSMQDLSLNDDPLGSRPRAQQSVGVSNSGPVYSNVQNQYSNIQDSQSMQPVQNQYSNINLQMAQNAQNGSQYVNVNIQNQYSNVQNENQFSNVHGSQTQQPSQQFQPPQPVQRQRTQEAGYGAASYVYSTTGNVQQVYQQHNGNGPEPANGTLPQNNIAPAHQPQPQPRQPQQQAQSNTMSSPENLGSSYAMRSQLRQQTGIQPMPNHNAHMPGMKPMPYANGAFNGNGAGSNVQPYVPVYNPANFKPEFGPIAVSDPILVQSPGVFAGPPHWTYSVVVRDVKKIPGQQEFAAVVSNVRRRFRHFVALEERLRADCLGAILPPRPDKHQTRAIDEASARQSAQFALQRANELQVYLNALRLHPVAGNSTSLRMFLTLPDHLGIAWPEVSSSLVTRLTQAGTNTAVKVAEGTSAVIAELNSENQIMAGEDNSELLALASSEGLRISGVLQSVPKIENMIAAIAEQSHRMNNNGMEMQKLVNNVLAHEKQFSGPFEVLSSGLLRSGRRTSRLAVELGASAQVFTLQYKLCRYERLAFSDRRSALVRRRDARKEADKKAQKLVMNQHSLQSMGKFDVLGGYGRDASLSDEIAVDSVKEAEEVGHILRCEVARVTQQRRDHWNRNLKVMAANLREAHAERAAIWESCRNALMAPSTADGNWSNGHQPDMTADESLH